MLACFIWQGGLLAVRNMRSSGSHVVKAEDREWRHGQESCYLGMGSDRASVSLELVVCDTHKHVGVHTHTHMRLLDMLWCTIFRDHLGRHFHLRVLCVCVCVCVPQAQSALPQSSVQLTSGGQELLYQPARQPPYIVKGLDLYASIWFSFSAFHLFPPVFLHLLHPPPLSSLPLSTFFVHFSLIYVYTCHSFYTFFWGLLSFSPYFFLFPSVSPHLSPSLAPASPFLSLLPLTLKSKHCLSLSTVNDSSLSSIYRFGEPLQACHSVCTVATWPDNGSFQPQFPPKWMGAHPGARGMPFNWPKLDSNH